MRPVGGLLSRQVEHEFLVLNRASGVAHALSGDMAVVWASLLAAQSSSDDAAVGPAGLVGPGPGDLLSSTGLSRAAVDAAVTQLADAGLIEGPELATTTSSPPDVGRVILSRRGLLAGAGVVSGAGLVSLLLPEASAAASPAPVLAVLNMSACSTSNSVTSFTASIRLTGYRYAQTGLTVSIVSGGAERGTAGLVETNTPGTYIATLTVSGASNGAMISLAARTSSATTIASTTFTYNCQPAGTWVKTSAPSTARSLHTASVLADGTVLIAGGNNGSGYLTSAELYDPANGKWSTTGSLSTARVGHTASVLSDGQVLVVGGSGASVLASAELYNPMSKSWTTTGSLATARQHHTASVLANGQVLVAGGQGSTGPDLGSAELYNPATGIWTTTGALTTNRDNHTASVLANGRVLVAGGYSAGTVLALAELYNPATGTWTATGSLGVPRWYHVAVVLADGRVLVTGGSGQSTFLASTELYNPATGTWSTTGSMTTARRDHTASVLANGYVLVAGGDNSSSGVLASTELYNPASSTWTATGSCRLPRYNHTASVLANGKVLAAGGVSGVREAELYQP